MRSSTHVETNAIPPVKTKRKPAHVFVSPVLVYASKDITETKTTHVLQMKNARKTTWRLSLFHPVSTRFSTYLLHAHCSLYDKVLVEW
ncbi:hypothetical protein ANCCAN_16153, partial [Ancylostoma caninum]